MCSSPIVRGKPNKKDGGYILGKTMFPLVRPQELGERISLDQDICTSQKDFLFPLVRPQELGESHLYQRRDVLLLMAFPLVRPQELGERYK